MDAKRGNELCREELARWNSHHVHIDRHAITAVLNHRDELITHLNVARNEIKIHESTIETNLSRYSERMEAANLRISKLETTLFDLEANYATATKYRNELLQRVADEESKFADLKAKYAELLGKYEAK